MKKSLTERDAVCEAARCLLCEDAPCSRDCPAGTDPARFIRQIRFENYKGAARTVRNNNIMGGVCSFTCPAEKLCEKECTARALEGEPIDIPGLQRFAYEYGREHDLETPKKEGPAKGRVAIIGAGPAGMSCAFELLKKGCEVTIFEKERNAGGVARWLIPHFRLAEDAVSYSVETLENLGAEFVFGKAVEDKDAVCRLLSGGFDACFIGAGLGRPLELPVFKGYDNVRAASDFLRNTKGGKKMAMDGMSVVVIGGGSVAMDAAVTAKALGAKRVYAVSLEWLEELPADPEEIDMAEKSHVIFRPNAKITEVVPSGKKIAYVKGVETEWVNPCDFSPANARSVEGTEFSLKADYVIQAIGSRIGTEPGNIAPELTTTGRGTIAVGDDFSTNIPGVFAGGDVTGPSSIAKAVGDGKKAAEAVIKLLNH